MEELRINITDDSAGKSPPPAQEPVAQQQPADPTPRFTQAEWERMHKVDPGMREHLVKVGAMQSPQTQAQKVGPASPPTTAQASNIQEEAERRLKKIALEKEIDQEMRAQDMAYAKEQEHRDEERARRSELRLTTQQDRDETYAARQEVLDERRAQREAERQQLQQERDENSVARQESADAKLAARQHAAQNRQQERDEDYAARQELRDWKMAQREVKLVPEVVALHDEEAYAKNARAAMASRERAERQKEVRREIDPKFAQEEQDRENKEKARLMAMGGAAIGGKVGRMMGIASQVLGNAESMRMLGGMFGQEQKRAEKVAQPSKPSPADVRQPQPPAADDARAARPQRAEPKPPPPAANIPASERVQQPRREENRNDRRMETLNRVGRELDEERRPKLPPPLPTQETNVREQPAPASPQETRVSAAPTPKQPDTAVAAGPPPSQTAKAAKVAQAAPKAAAAAEGAAGAGAASGAMAGAMAAMPIIGAAAAVASLVKESIEEIGENRRKMVPQGVDASKAVVSGDVDQRMVAMAKGFDTLVDHILPVDSALGHLVGKPMKEFAHGLDEMRGVVKQSTERLAQYNGGLSQQVAMQNVAEMFRDIRRANQMGGQFAQTNAARFNLEQKVQDLVDRVLPGILKATEGAFNAATNLTKLVERIVDCIMLVIERLELVPGVAASLGLVADATIPFYDVVRAAIRAVLSGTDAQIEADERRAWSELLSLRRAGDRDPRTVTPLPSMPGPVIAVP